MAAAHPLVIFAFVVAVVGLCSVGWKAHDLSHKTDEAYAQISKKQSATRPEGSSKVSCWIPESFESPANAQYAQAVCSSRFMNVVQGKVPSDKAGITPRQAAGAPAAAGNATAQVPFETAMKVMADAAPGMAMMPGGDKEEQNPMDRLMGVFGGQVFLALLGLAVAILLTRLAKSHSCYLSAGWRHALTGDNHSDMVARRVKTLLSTKSLSVGYLAFTGLMILGWIIIGISMFHADSQLKQKIDEVAQMKKSMIEKMTQLKKMQAQIQAMMAAGQMPPAEMLAQMPPPPPPTQDSGEFSCDFEVASRSISKFSIGCSYDVTRPAAPFSPPEDPTPLLQSWRSVIMGNCSYSVFVAILLLTHLFTMYYPFAVSRMHSVAPVLTHLGIRPKSTKMFGFTDLGFVAAFTDLGADTGLLVMGEGPKEMSKMNGLAEEKEDV